MITPKDIKKEKLEFYEYIEDDVEVRLDTLNYKFERPLPAGKWKRFWYDARWIREWNNKNFYRVKIKKVLLYIKDNDKENKKAEGIKMYFKMWWV